MTLVLAFLLLLASPLCAAPVGTLSPEVTGKQAPRTDGPRPRVIVSADFPPLDVIPGGAGYGPAEKRSDPDDVQSMVRFLLYTNEFDVEALVASSATFANVANKQPLLDILDLYDKVDENLRSRDARYPTASDLRSLTWQGRSGNWGKPAAEVLGEGKDSEASEAIIRIVDSTDPRPVWVLVWGGPQEVAQAIWKVQQERSPAELDQFISKLRIFMIGLGDKPGQDGSGQWMLDQFPNLFVIVSQKTYSGMFAQNSALGSLAWLNANIREGHGPLGNVYPRSGFYPDTPGMQEGDTPSFLYLVSALRGMNDPENPDEESWGGRYEQRNPSKNHWYDGPGAESVRKWLPDFQKDFARRADWMLPSTNQEPLGAVSESRVSIEQLMQAENLPAVSVAIMDDGKMVWTEAFGFADLEHGIAATPNTKFRIASISKAVTSVALGLLVESGRLNLDVPVRTYVPEYPDKGHPITTRQLAGHLSGIPHYNWDDVLNRVRYRDVIHALDKFQDRPLLFVPGERFSYSSFGWNLIGAVVARTSETAFLSYMQDHVFEPAGMEHTIADHYDQIIPERTAFYVVEDGTVINAPAVDNSDLWAAGGFLSTPEDLVMFGTALLEGTLVSEDTRELLFRPQTTSKGLDTGYGLGWRSRQLDGHRFVGHGGSHIGATSQLLIFPDQSLVIALATNANSEGFANLATEIARRFLR